MKRKATNVNTWQSWGSKFPAALLVAFFALFQSQLATAAIVNTVTATATAIDGKTLTVRATASVTVVAAAPEIAVVKKVASLTGNGLNDTGDVINYVFEVTNTGNVTLGNITVVDPLVAVAGGPIATLAPGFVDKVTFTAHYAITGHDLKAGQAVNQATATGTAPDGKIVSDLSDDSNIAGNTKTITTLNAKPAITRQVMLTLKDAAFVPGRAVLKPQWVKGIGKLIATLEQAQSSLQLNYVLGNEAKDLALKRVQGVRQQIEAAWAARNEPYVLSIDSRVAGTK